MSARPAPPRVLAVAGSDSGGGAGIQADLKTMLACGVHGMSVVTAVTAQNSTGVHGSWPLTAAAIEAQFRAVADDIGVDAVKTGMLVDADTVALVAELLSALPGDVSVVADPVSISKHGDNLLARDALRTLRTRLFPRVTVLTPNLDEARELTGRPVRDRDDMRAAASALLESGPAWVLLKGGHLAEGPADDLLTDGVDEHWLSAPRSGNKHTHGTGCTLASALAAHLALGRTVPEAAQAAKDYVTGAIAAGFPLGSGVGPVDHGWRMRA